MEDRIRGYLSRAPIVYAVIGAVAIVLFWRGIWDLADILYRAGGLWTLFFHPFVSLVLSVVVLLATGLFVSFFIGDRIILSGLKHEKKIEEKTEIEVRQEETMIAALHAKLDKMVKELEEVKASIKKHNDKL